MYFSTVDHEMFLDKTSSSIKHFTIQFVMQQSPCFIIRIMNLIIISPLSFLLQKYATMTMSSNVHICHPLC